MLTLFYEGGVLFMGILTLLLLIIFCLAIVAGVKLLRQDAPDVELVKSQLTYIKSVGLFALVTGILGQMIGLFSAFQNPEVVKTLTPEILAYGFRISSICTLYGIFIFLLAYTFWFGLDVLLNKQLRKQ